MPTWGTWCVRAGALLGAVLTLFVPAPARVSAGPGPVVLEAAGRNPLGTAVFGLCCLLTVAVIAAIVVWLMRTRSRRR